jgi:putative ferrous iron transport protein C
MILSKVRDYLKQRGQCTLSDIALHFDTDADAVRGMLDVWIKKGKVEKRSATESCGTSCQSCDPASTEIYFWRETHKPINITTTIPNNCDHK